jgi:Holliday junction resolvasome RuvABC DNA-binding subunit
VAAPPARADDPLFLALAQLGYKKSEIDGVVTRLAERGLGEAPLPERLSAALGLFGGR